MKVWIKKGKRKTEVHISNLYGSLRLTVSIALLNYALKWDETELQSVQIFTNGKQVNEKKMVEKENGKNANGKSKLGFFALLKKEQFDNIQ